MRKLMIVFLLAATAGCSAEQIARQKAWNDQWNAQMDECPLCGLDAALSGVAAAHDVRAARRLMR